jgi:hypothetical protein
MIPWRLGGACGTTRAVWQYAPKGHDSIAQGNALGINNLVFPRPEGAAFRISETGLIHVPFRTDDW